MDFPKVYNDVTLKAMLSTCLLAMALNCFSQTFELTEYPVEIEGEIVPFPYTGGFNNPQMLQMDLDFNGEQDLVMFDRDGDIFLPFLYNGGATPLYLYAPEFKSDFPQVEHWVVSRDVNNDGLNDLFVSSMEPAPGIQVYLAREEGGRLAFDLLMLDQDYIFNVLTYRVGNNLSNLDVTDIDIPAIWDVDLDGDLDVLTFQRGNGNVLFYKNMQVEENLPVNRIVFELVDDCWGGFFEDAFSELIDLSPNPGECASDANGGDARRHAGSTLQVFDPDRDGLQDILIGDLTSSKITALYNQGTPDVAHMTSIDVEFPFYDEPVDLPSFVSPFYFDVDADGDDDLLFSPNLPSPNAIATNQIRFYENIGEDEDLFTLSDPGFLSSETIDFGIKTAPCLLDLNGDGLIDILLGTEFDQADPRAGDQALVSLVNTGTSTDPSFTLDQLDFGGFSDFLDQSLAFAPAAGDLDNDGDLDLVIGDDEGRLFLAENIGGAGNPVLIQGAVYNWMGIDVGQYAMPALADLDNDGDLDLLVGERNGNNNEDGERCGNINYFENVGTSEDPIFNSEPDDPCYGEILTVDPFQLFGYSAPFVYEGDEEKLLFTGSYLGSIRRFKIDENRDDFVLLDSVVGNINEGVTTSISMADLNSDGILEIVCGNARGGLAIYTSNYTVQGTTDMVNIDRVNVGIEILPNPVNLGDQVFIELNGTWDSDLTVSVFNAKGSIVYEGQNFSYTEKISISTEALNSGIYIIEIKDHKGRISIEKFVVR